MRIVGVVLAILLMVSTSLASEVLVVPGERIGPLSINTPLIGGVSILQGMTDDVVISPPDSDGDTKVFSQNLLLGFWANSQKIIFTVFSQNSLYRTQEDLGVGSTPDEVEAVYGAPDDTIGPCGVWNQGIGFCLGQDGKVMTVAVFGKEDNK